MKIFVGNLDFSATESSIRSLFERYGQVEQVSVVTDRDTGRSRGFAFVEMPDSTQADQAIKGLNGVDLDGRALNVNEARPKPQGGGGYSRGGQKASGMDQSGPDYDNAPAGGHPAEVTDEDIPF